MRVRVLSAPPPSSLTTGLAATVIFVSTRFMLSMIYISPMKFGVILSLFPGWHSHLRVAVLDCSEESNTETCREYEITAYPTVKV